MKLTESKGVLVRELNITKGVVEKKTTIPILSNVLIEASADRITLTATDLELGIRCSCPAKTRLVLAFIQATAPGRRLVTLARRAGALPRGQPPCEVA